MRFEKGKDTGRQGKFKVIFVLGDRTKSLSLSKNQVFIVLFIQIFFIFIFFDWINSLLQRYELKKLKEINEQKDFYFSVMEEKIKFIEEKISRIENGQNKLRIMVGLSPLFGVGGKNEEKGLDERVNEIDEGIQSIYSEFLKKDLYVSSLPTIKPVRGGDIASEFGPRRDPFTDGISFHDGVDFAAPYGSEVYATGNGKVVKVGYDVGGLGLFVKIKHMGDIWTTYGHLSRVAVSEGQYVRRGQVIGYVGMSGRTTGPHLHYEVSVKGKKVNPRMYIFE